MRYHRAARALIAFLIVWAAWVWLGDTSSVSQVLAMTAVGSAVGAIAVVQAA